MSKIIQTVVLCAVGAMVFGLAGCSKITVLRTKEMVASRDTLQTNMQASMDASFEAVRKQLLEEHNALLAEQTRLLDEMKTSAEMLRLLRADQLVRFNELDRRITAIESNLTESHARISRLDRQTAEVTRRIDRRLASEEEAANQRNLQIEKLFEIAMSDFNAGRVDLAIGGFRDIVTQFPESPFAIDAEYWVAESYFAKKDYAEAEKEYIEFIKKYPDGAKSCAVFYKLGLAYEHQEKNKSRDMIWNNLLERCPGTTEAQAVQAQMRR